MACGLPIIAFENSGPKEILADGKYGILIPKYEVVQFAQEIKDMMQNSTKRKLYSEKSLERISSFSIEEIIKEWHKIL